MGAVYKRESVISSVDASTILTSSTTTIQTFVSLNSSCLIKTPETSKPFQNGGSTHRRTNRRIQGGVFPFRQGRRWNDHDQGTRDGHEIAGQNPTEAELQ